MYSGKEPQGQSEISEGHCIKEGKLFHLERNLDFFKVFLLCYLWTNEITTQNDDYFCRTSYSI